jgi:hypothetical protein
MIRKYEVFKFYPVLILILKYFLQSELHYTDIITLKMNTSQSNEADGSKLESLG